MTFEIPSCQTPYTGGVISSWANLKKKKKKTRVIHRKGFLKWSEKVLFNLDFNVLKIDGKENSIISLSLLLKFSLSLKTIRFHLNFLNKNKEILKYFITLVRF